MNQNPPSGADQQRLNMMMAIAALQRRVKIGASNFYWIAGLSVINSLVYIFGGGITFVVGLGITQLIDGFAYGMATAIPNYTLLIRGVGLLLNLFVAGLFVLFGYLAAKGRRMAFIIGMLLYSLDAILMLAFAEWIGFAFHLFFLWLLFNGVQALGRLRKVLPQTASDPSFPKNIGS